MTELYKVIKKRKYEILLTSLLLLLFGNLIIPSDYWAHLRPILLIQNMTVGLILFFEQKKNAVFVLQNLMIYAHMFADFRRAG